VPQTFDIFCRVIDNYGDISVCWRLARRLAGRAGSGRVRLWVDNLAVFARIAPAVVPGSAVQTLEGVEIRHWPDTSPPHAVPPRPHPEPPAPPSCGPAALIEPADVVIEAFACTPPREYLRRMTARQIWINLEYLSAESWIESCHGLPSLQPGGLRKFFFFPGFTAGTGGLLREPGLAARRDAWRADADARQALLARLGIPAAWLRRLRAGARLVYAFCYPGAPLPALMRALSASERDTLVLLPEGAWPADMPRAIETPRGLAQAHTHPFVDQDTFDRLLWSADLNIVRGEDSLVRAIWAGRPMIWQAYRQEDGAHLEKLEAWLARTPYGVEVRALMRAWNTGDGNGLENLLPPLLEGPRLAEWREQARAWSSMLEGGMDLADRLARFCTEHAQTR